jgi:hypothetical protein
MVPRIFKPGIFSGLFEDMGDEIKAQNSAQAVFEDWIKNNSKVIYGTAKDGIVYKEVYFSGIQNIQDTHKALLLCIEPIEKKECEHKKTVIHQDARPLFENTFHVYCANCEKKLKAKSWEVIE